MSKRILALCDERLTFFVAPQVMLYENRCESSAVDRWMLSPPKKKKLQSRVSLQSNTFR